MNYLWHILVIINIYMLLAVSLNLLAGYTGLLSMCHAAFYGIGAYTTALLMTTAGFDFFSALGAAIIITAVISWAIAIPILKLKGDYFVLATLGFQTIVYSLLYNSIDLTGGPNGIPGIPIPQIFGIKFDTPFRYFLLSGFLTLINLVIIWLLIYSPFGRLLRAVREDELAAAAIGKNIPRIKVTIFIIAAAFAGVSGALFAGYLRYIDPSTFTVIESIFILSIIVIGGAGSFWGPVIGTAFMVLLPELLRFLQLSSSMAANGRQIIYGLLIIVLMRFRPQGLLGKYKFE